eukprot:371886_1
MSAENIHLSRYPAYLILSIIFNIILLLPTCVIAYNITKYCLHPPAGKEKPAKALFYYTLLFILSTIGCLSLLILIDICNIQPYTKSITLLLIISCITYLLQKYLLLIVLFCRSYYVFNGTGLEISTKLIRIFTIMFIITPFVLVLCSIITIVYLSKQTSLIIGIFIMLLIVFEIVALIVLIIQKLYTIYKLMTHSSERNQLIKLITKTTLLMSISVITSIIGPILIFIRFDNIQIYIISGVVISIETFINLICITLSFTCFNKYYVRYCNFGDNFCKLFWYNILQLDTEEICKMEEEEQNECPENEPQLIAMMSGGIIIRHIPDHNNHKNSDIVMFTADNNNQQMDNIEEYVVFDTPTNETNKANDHKNVSD